MTTLPTLNSYSGAIPDKATMNKDEFANAVHPYLNWWNDYIPTLENWSQNMTTLSGELQTLSNDINTKHTEVETWHTETEAYKNDAQTAKTLAQNYANEDEDIEVETGYYSAKHYAIKAQEIKDSIVAELPEGTISDDIIETNTTWSSKKINDELWDKVKFEDRVIKKDIDTINYNNGIIDSIIFVTGNKTQFYYDENGFLVKEEWTDTDGTTIKVRITYTYKIITIDNFDYIQLDKTTREEL